MRVFRIKSEWDVGEEGLVFTSERAAVHWLLKNQVVLGALEPGESIMSYVKNCIDDGLIGFEELDVVGEE
jgi:hypothetical protein